MSHISKFLSTKHVVVRRLFSNSASKEFSVIREKLLQLRGETSLCLNACHDALKASNSDLVLARQLLRNSSGKSYTSSPETTSAILEGSIFVSQPRPDIVCLVSLKCSTDFVSRSCTFAELAQNILNLTYKDRNPIDSPLVLETLSSYRHILKEPICLGEVRVIEKHPDSIFGIYLHGKLPNGMGMISSVVELMGRSGPTGLQPLASKIAVQVAGTNPASSSDLEQQEYLFAEGERKTSVKEILSTYDASVTKFDRLSIR